MHVRANMYMLYRILLGYSDVVLFQIRSNMKRWESPLPATPVPWTIDIYIQVCNTVKFANSIFQAGFLETKQSIMTSEFYRISKLCKKFTFGTCEAKPRGRRCAFEQAKCMASCSRQQRKQDRPLASQKFTWLPHLASLDWNWHCNCKESKSRSCLMVRCHHLNRMNLCMVLHEICWIAMKWDHGQTFRWHRHGQQMVQRMQGWDLGAKDPEREAWQDSMMFDGVLKCS